MFSHSPLWNHFFEVPGTYWVPGSFAWKAWLYLSYLLSSPNDEKCFAKLLIMQFCCWMEGL